MSKEPRKTSRHFGYRLRLNAEEFDKLIKCSQHSGLKTSDFLRMLINDYEYFMEENNKMDIQNNEISSQDDWISKVDYENFVEDSDDFEW